MMRRLRLFAFFKPIWRRVVLICCVLLVGITLSFYLLFQGPPEPVYKGIDLSDWIEGKAANQGGATHQEVFEVLNVVDVEALPWLSWAYPRYARQKVYESLYLRYLNFYRDHTKLQRYLPNPTVFKPTQGQYNTMTLLGRIAPGTAYEDQVLQDLLASDEPDNATTANIRLRCFGNFTNQFELVVPVLMSGLTNNNHRTVRTSIDQLKKFGPKVCDLLYPIALQETGHIRPFQLAIKNIDSDVFEKLMEENQNY